MMKEHDVVIVGAGPAGLAAALTLGSYGIDALVVERRATTSELPRANTVSTATMELLRRWGLEAAARERSMDMEWQMLVAPSPAEAAAGEPVEVGLPSRQSAALISPTSPAAVAQSELEPVLEDRLASHGTVRLERGLELADLELRDDGGVVLGVRGPDGSARIGARYLIGADGIRSAVRERLGISSVGEQVLEEKLAILFRGPVWELVGEHRYGGYFSPEDPLGRFLIPINRPDRWVLGMDWDPRTRDPADVTEAQAHAWIREAAGDPDLPIEIDRIMPVRYGVALADRFREGDAFLVGDAAHRVTPRGGTGLNTAIRDAFDIGWKLAWVLRGWAGQPLLETYERERRPVAEHNIARSMRPDGSLLNSLAGLAADVGGRIPHTWIARGESLVSTLDLLDEGLTLFTGPDWAGPEPDGGAGSPPLRVERVDAIAARAIGLTTTGALLARPDGIPVALWSGGDPDPQQLARAIAGAAHLSMAVRR